MRPFISQTVATVTLGALVLGSSVAFGVEEGGNPYADIVVRNAFGLKPPEPPKAPEPPKEETAPPNIFMTGVTSIGGKKQLYLKLVIPGEKEPKYLRLAENEREGAIEVVEIMPKTGRARIKNKGVPQTISFESNGAAMAAAAAAPSVPGVPGRPPGVPAVPGAAPVSANNSVANRPITSTLPVSPSNTAVGGSSTFRPNGSSSSNVLGAQPGATQSTPTRSIPTRPLRINPGSGGASYVAPSNPEVSPVAQVIGMAVSEKASPGGPPIPQ